MHLAFVCNLLKMHFFILKWRIDCYNPQPPKKKGEHESAEKGQICCEFKSS